MAKNSGTAVTSRTANRMPVRVTTSSRVIERVRTGDGMPYWSWRSPADGVATSKVA